MARYLEVHPVDPQPRVIATAVDVLRRDGILVYPTDSSMALGVRVGNAKGIARVRELRRLDDRHHFTLVCKDFAQLATYVQVSNPVFRTVKSATPGPYTFILRATREVPRRLQHPRKRTVGVRIPDNVVAHTLLTELGEPLVSSTLLLPGDEEPLTDGWEAAERLGDLVDAVLDDGTGGREQTTVVDLSADEPEVIRVGAGDPDRFR